MKLKYGPDMPGCAPNNKSLGGVLGDSPPVRIREIVYGAGVVN